MADLGYAKRLLSGIPDEKTRSIMLQFAEYTYSNLRFGVPDHQTRAANFQSYFLRSTTPTSSAEFSIVHGLPTTPHYAIPLLPLDTPGARMGFLTVTRSADTKRVYLKCEATSTNTPFAILVE